MYTITKDGPSVHTTKKFGDTSISSRFFVLTSVPFWTEGVLTDHYTLRCRKLLKLSPHNDDWAPLVIFFFPPHHSSPLSLSLARRGGGGGSPREGRQKRLFALVLYQYGVLATST